MMIKRLWLKNVRSYGETPEGRGIEVCFEPGVNRIAGKNGSGKSTLIEAIGYALFGAQPPYEENFRLDTYFLRTGEKSGSITVEFSCAGSDYQIEKGIGQHRLCTKIIRMEDGFTEAEGEEETSQFLCRLLRVSNRNRLAEGFNKLIGIKQGRLTFPFDSSPKHARDYFDPLLDVEIFRECFDRLLPVQHHIERLQQELEVQKSSLDERINERKNCCDEKEQAELRHAQCVDQLNEATRILAILAEEREALIQKERRIQEIEKELADAKSACDLTAEIERNAREQLKKSQEAVRIVSETREKHNIFVESEAAMRLLQEQYQQKISLEKSRAASEKLEVGYAERAAAAHAQMSRLSEQLSQKQASYKKRTEQFRIDQQKHEASQLSHEVFLKEAQKYEASYMAIERWQRTIFQNLTRMKQLEEQLANDWQIVSDWQALNMAEAESDNLKIRERSNMVRQDIAVVVERRNSLNRQVQQIKGGVCPFLQESCRQFDPAKIIHDCQSLEVLLGELKQKLAGAEKELELSEKALTACREKERLVTKSRYDMQNRWQQLLTLRVKYNDNDILAACAHLASSVTQHGLESEFQLPSQMELNITTDNPQPEFNMGLVGAIIQENHALGECLSTLLRPVQPCVQQKIAAAEAAQSARAAEKKRLEIEEQSIACLQQDIENIQSDMQQLQQRLNETAALIRQQCEEICLLSEKIKSFDGIESKIQLMQRTEESCREDHEKYLGAVAVAAEIEEKQKAMEQAQADLKLCQETVAAKSHTLTLLRSDFDTKRHIQIQDEWLCAKTKVARLSEAINYVQQDLLQATQRHQEWLAAVDSMKNITQDIIHKEASIQILDRARYVLKKAAPVVAQSLCDRIAQRAQEIFNCLNHEPALIGWDATNYSVRVNPGLLEKRFAMLSGGEQTKLAVAMNLAMLHEFLNCKFLVFDEPTYGADEESRSKIADAVVNASHHCQFEQLLLVSHDNAFDGKIENVLELDKKAGTGSYVVNI